VHDRCDTGYSTVTARSEYTKPYMTPYETRNLCAKFSQFHVPCISLPQSSDRAVASLDGS